eukprot:g67885.t1
MGDNVAHVILLTYDQWRTVDGEMFVVKGPSFDQLSTCLEEGRTPVPPDIYDKDEKKVELDSKEWHPFNVGFAYTTVRISERGLVEVMSDWQATGIGSKTGSTGAKRLSSQLRASWHAIHCALVCHETKLKDAMSQRPHLTLQRDEKRAQEFKDRLEARAGTGSKEARTGKRSATMTVRITSPTTWPIAPQRPTVRASCRPMLSLEEGSHIVHWVGQKPHNDRQVAVVQLKGKDGRPVLVRVTTAGAEELHSQSMASQTVLRVHKEGFTDKNKSEDEHFFWSIGTSLSSSSRDDLPLSIHVYSGRVQEPKEKTVPLPFRGKTVSLEKVLLKVGDQLRVRFFFSNNVRIQAKRARFA